MFHPLAHCCLFALQPLPRTDIIYSLACWVGSRNTPSLKLQIKWMTCLKALLCYIHRMSLHVVKHQTTKFVTRSIRKQATFNISCEESLSNGASLLIHHQFALKRVDPKMIWENCLLVDICMVALSTYTNTLIIQREPGLNGQGNAAKHM